MKRNYYIVLGIPETATASEVQHAYRQLARKYHPDVSGGDTTAAFREVQQAWDTLGDEERRQHYDAELQRGRMPPPRSRTPAGWQGARAEMDCPLHLELQLEPWEAEAGGTFPIDLPRLEPCPHCGGRGRDAFAMCGACGGRGECLCWENFALGLPGGLQGGERLDVPLEGLGLVHSRLLIRVHIM